MHFLSVASAVLGLVQAVHSASLPRPNEVSVNALEKRIIHQTPVGTVDCWDFQRPFLPSIHAKIDRDMEIIRGALQRTPAPIRPREIGWIINHPVIFYWCQDGPRKGDGSIDLNDFQEATYWMDQKCGRYTPAYFRWAGSDEIVGRLEYRLTPDICKGMV